MTAKSAAVLAMVQCLIGVAVAAQQPITKAKSISATATIQAIDSTARTITLREAGGQEDTYSVGPLVKRFDELKVGDTVKATYYESVVLQAHKPGEAPGAATPAVTGTAGKSALPSGTLAVQDKMTVTVKAIDPAAPSITVTTPDGRTVTRKVEDKKTIAGLNVGDQIDITYTRAILTSVERGK